jgi:hypothetical protein
MVSLPAGLKNRTTFGALQRALSIAVLLAAVLLFPGCEQPGGGPVLPVTPALSYGPRIDIESGEDLGKIGRDPAYPLLGRYTLKGDLTLVDWMPVGGPAAPFAGTFDGGGHEITLMSIASGALIDNAAGDPGTGLGVFGWTRGNGPALPAVIKNLHVRTALNLSISKTGDYYVGALAGYAGEYTEIGDVVIEGSLSFSNTNTDAPKRPVYVGGLAGVLIASELKDSKVEADITGFGKAGNGVYNYVGGLVGMFDRNEVSRGPNPKPAAGKAFAGASIINCHATGDVSGSTAGEHSNVFAGGIAGGSFYDMKTWYSGRIEDCSSSGDVTASGGAYWSWAGGIAGCIVGDGHDDPSVPAAGPSATGPTRIVRCHAKGMVTAGGPSGSWPYAGGITAYNYYGGLVSQCRFDGTVTAAGEGINDYTGGIAGYNSKQAGGHRSRIEDCWSAGEVRGNLNAGGIVGQNQVDAIIRRCYSRADIVVRAAQGTEGSMSRQGAGGIAGYNAPEGGASAPGTVEHCAALNPSITSTGGFDRVRRVAGDGGGSLTDNRAWSGMIITISGGTAPAPDPAGDGADCAQKPDIPFYEGLEWDFATVWKMDTVTGYPILQWQD